MPCTTRPNGSSAATTQNTQKDDPFSDRPLLNKSRSQLLRKRALSGGQRPTEARIDGCGHIKRTGKAFKNGFGNCGAALHRIRD